MTKKIILLSVATLAIINIIFLLRLYSNKSKDKAFINDLTRIDEGFFEGKNTEVKQDVEGKDIRIRYFWIEDNKYTINDEVISLLIDKTLEESGINPRTRIIKSWVAVTPVHPKLFITDDERYLVFEAGGEISIYDFDDDLLINSLKNRASGINETNLVGVNGDSVLLGLFEGVGGVCEENAFSVNLNTFEVSQLTPKSEMAKCQP